MNLVTGASGILGSHVLVELLRQGETVIPCKQSGSSLEGTRRLFDLYFEDAEERFNALQWRTLDLLDQGSVEDALEGIKRVYHCAALVSYKGSDRRKLFQVNEQGTANLVNQALLKPGIAFCHVSSIATLNNSDVKGALNEQVYWKSNGRESDYAISKYNAEREVWRGMEEGLEAVIVNPGLIMAPEFWHQSSANLMQLMRKGNRFYTDGLVAPVMARDVALVMLALMQQQQFGKRFVVVEQNYSYRDFFGIIRQGYGYKGPMILLPKSLLLVIAWLERFFSFFIGRDPRFTKAVLRSLHNRQPYSNALLLNTLLDFRFQEIKSGIPELCRHFLKPSGSRRQKSRAQGLKNGLRI